MNDKAIIPAAALAQHIAILGKTGAGKSYAARGIVEGLLEEKKRVCIIDPKGDWWGLRLSATGKSAGYPVVIFGGEHADVPINAHAGGQIAELVGTGNRPCIIDLSQLGPDHRSKFFTEFAAGLFKHNKGALWLVIDEVHNFAFQGRVLDIDSGKMLHWANRLASEGRGRGITIIMASQRPQKVHKDTLTCAETLIAMRVIHALDREAIKDWMDGAGDKERSAEVLKTLAGMPRGAAWVWSPEIGHFQRTTAPTIRTFDSMRGANELGPATALKGWAEIDLNEIRGRLESVVKEVESNDPRKLKQRIAELERQVGNPKTTTSKATADTAVAQQTLQAVTRAAAERERFWKARERALMASLTRHVGTVDRARKLLESVKLNGEMTPAPPPAATGAQIHHGGTEKTAARFVAHKTAAAGHSETMGGTITKIGRAEGRILAALATHGACSKNKLAILCGYSASGGGFGNALGALRSGGLVQGSDPIEITPDGEALGPFEALPTGAALCDWWLGHRELGKAERTILTALREHGEMGKEILAEATGYEVSGGGFGNALGKLRTLGLIKGSATLELSAELCE